uniref:O-phosphoseryl-tRNA(Sec) selenium transferase n=1 Tax=Bactrocera latifrons TaxID=174628 RepID=A0A0K8VX52_BACLA
MDFRKINISRKLVPENYLKLAQDAQKSRDTEKNELLEKRKLPLNGWTETLIEELVQQLSLLDSNNFPKKSGVGEREARIACCWGTHHSATPTAYLTMAAGLGITKAEIDSCFQKLQASWEKFFESEVRSQKIKAKKNSN